MIFISSSHGIAQHVIEESPKIYIAIYKPDGPALDGDLNESFWDDVKWSKQFVDIEGPLKPTPPFSTRVKIAYTDEALFIGAELKEPHIWAYQKEKNKAIFRYDNDFEVFIDPDGDHCNYYELELNALNTIWELSLPYPYRNKGKARNPDNMKGMESAVKIYGSINDPSDIDSSWTVEIMFPFEGFKKYNSSSIPPRRGDHWRINFSRVQWNYTIQGETYIKKEGTSPDNWVWSPQYEINMHAPEHWGFLYFGSSPSDEVIKDEWSVTQDLVKTIMKQNRGLSTKTQDPSFNTTKKHPINSAEFKSEGHIYRYSINSRTCIWKSIIKD
ncbi:MAG: carbohydrate-binding family 9-like protein [Saprospiraceae bacterium]|nr:carbohydrate-binding family 9-like protein [Saprospiraceae bacterium]